MADRIQYGCATVDKSHRRNERSALCLCSDAAPNGRGLRDRELHDDFYGTLAQDYQQKRNKFCSALAKAGLTPSIPEGAYYVLADVSRLPGDTGKARSMYLLEKTGVAGVPGEAFFSGKAGANFIRFSYAKTEPDLDEACRRLTAVDF